MGSNKKSETEDACNKDIKLYARRWFLLVLFMLYTSNIALHWFEFVSITNIVARYYDVPRTLVEWTAIMVMAGRTFLLFPALFLMDKLETKNTLVLASTLCLIGSFIKACSVSPEKFYVAMIGQVFSALALVFTYSLIGRFSAAWFSSKEISRAGALCCTGETVGCAFAFLLPTRLVPDSQNVEEVGKGMRYLHYFYTAWALLTVILLLIFFKSKPKHPPSAAQAHSRSNEDHQVYESVKKLLRNPSFVTFIFTQGITVGTGYNSPGTLLNEIIVNNFPNPTEHTGTIAFASLVSGIIGSVVLSYIQDKTRKYKCNAVSLSVANCICFASFIIATQMDSIIYVYITWGLYGFLVQGYYATTLQMGIELSFPIPEGITVATISVCVELVSMTSTAVYGLAIKQYGDVKSNTFVLVFLIMNTVATCLVPPNFKREEIERAAKTTEGRRLLQDSEEKPTAIATSTTSDL